MTPDDTKPVILPYTYRVLTHRRISILHPAGVQLTYTVDQIRHKLIGEGTLRDMCAHERMMFESALEYFDNHATEPVY